MRRADHRRPVLQREVGEEPADGEGRDAVEARGRLVGDEHGGAGRDRPGERDPLALPGREAVDGASGVVGEADDRERLHRPLVRLGPVDPAERQRELDVLDGREHAGEPRRLPDDADPRGAERGPRVAVERREGHAVDERPRPSSGRSSPARSARSVDLPEPDGPVTTVSVPGANIASKCSSAVCAP